jgi:hypothetical protein
LKILLKHSSRKAILTKKPIYPVLSRVIARIVHAKNSISKESLINMMKRLFKMRRLQQRCLRKENSYVTSPK